MKGVSPLIATVLLIAFTLSIAGLLGGWLSGLTKTQTETLEKSSKETMNCTGSVLNIINVVCGNATPNEPNALRIVLANEGNNALYGFSTFAQIENNQYINSTGGPTVDLPLFPGDHTTLEYYCPTICTDGSIVSKVRVSPSNCPTAWSEKLISVTCN
ncbi:MAG: archaellin/type IV pilin N-terminal domain-containing protein [Candidatus Aenigmatarchaeota archaeon]